MLNLLGRNRELPIRIRRSAHGMAAMTRDEMKKLVERLHRFWNTGDLSAISDLYAPDFVGHFPKASRLGDLKGHSGVRDAIERVRQAFPDWTETVEDIIIDGDKAVTRY